jgi:hypothetical protein
MLADPLQYVGEVGVEIDAVQTARHDQTLSDTDVLRAEFGPAKVPPPVTGTHGFPMRGARYFILAR